MLYKEKRTEMIKLSDWILYCLNQLKTLNVVYLLKVDGRTFAYPDSLSFTEHVWDLLDTHGSIRDGGYDCDIKTEKEWLAESEDEA